jgi:Na+-transporting NADH:ubiquinone oxidoreductase subunit NqrC
MTKRKKYIIISISLVLITVIIVFSYTVIKTIQKFENIKNDNNTNIIMSDSILSVKNLETSKIENLNLNNQKLFIHYWAT